MSTDTEWSEERTAELRRLAETLRDAQFCVAAEASKLPLRGGWSAPLDDAMSDERRASDAVLSVLTGATLLSLLSELERSRDEAGELVEAMERLREERDGLRDAFEDVMGALAGALGGDDGYAERPAELVWRLRDDRDGWKEEAGR